MRRQSKTFPRYLQKEVATKMVQFLCFGISFMSGIFALSMFVQLAYIYVRVCESVRNQLDSSILSPISGVYDVKTSIFFVLDVKPILRTLAQYLKK